MESDISIALNVFLLGFIISFGIAVLIKGLAFIIQHFTKESEKVDGGK